MQIRKIGDLYYVYYRDGDHLRTIATHSNSKSDAEKLDRAIKKRIKLKRIVECIQRAENIDPSQIDGLTDNRPQNTQKQDISAIIEIAQQYRELSEEHRSYFRFFAGWLKHHRVTDVKQITPAVCLQYLNEKYGKKSAKTYNNAKTALNTVFRLACIDCGLAASPFINIPNRLNTDVEHHRPITAEEFRTAFSRASVHWKALMLIQWCTGQRLETALRILEELSANPNTSAITIIPSKTARFGKAVTIPIHPALSKFVQDNLELLTSRKPEKWYGGNKNLTYVSSLFKACGILDNETGKASFHSLRQSFITRCDESGISRQQIRGIVGHTSDEMTDLYSYDKESAKAILNLNVEL